MVRIVGNGDQPSLGDLVALAAKDVSQLIQYEISLAKSELRMDAQRIGVAAVLGVVGLFVGCLVVVLLCFALAFGLNAAGIWLWASFLIVAGICVVLIALAALIAYLKVRKVTGMKLTRKTVQDGIEVLKQQAKSSPNGAGPDGATPAVANPAGSAPLGKPAASSPAVESGAR